MNLKSHDIVVFTDGSSRGNPGPGGWGAIIVADGKVIELGGREEHTTNNRMELQAAISALSFLKSNVTGQMSIIIYCDSTYVVNGITKWVHRWQEKGWRTANKKSVLNRDLWEDLVRAAHGKDIEWRHIVGHIGVAGNERCDEIATTYADLSTIRQAHGGEFPRITSSRQAAPTLYSGILENYGIRNILNVHGR